MKRNTVYLTLTTVLLLCIGLGGCGQKKQNEGKTKYRIITAKMTKLTSTLFFKGTIEPLNTYNIPSPTNGNVIAKNFTYGQFITKGQLLVTLRSSSLEKQYQDAFTDFIRKKQAYNAAKAKFESTESLMKEGIVSKDDFDTAKSSYNDGYLAFIQSRQTLRKILKALGLSDEDIFKLRLANREQIVATLERTTNTINVKSIADGIALQPLKDNNSSKSHKIIVGSRVKEGDTIVTIGDLTGIRVNVKVDEINIISIEKGQKVSITGVGFPGITLQGIVSAVSNQANPSFSGGLPNFPISIIVPNISPKQRKRIHVGMTAKIAMQLDKGQAIKIPINAVSTANGNSVVTVVNRRSGRWQKIPVTTGQTSLNQVVISHGLKPGDKIVVRY